MKTFPKSQFYQFFPNYVFLVKKFTEKNVEGIENMKLLLNRKQSREGPGKRKQKWESFLASRMKMGVNFVGKEKNSVHVSQKKKKTKIVLARVQK